MEINVLWAVAVLLIGLMLRLNAMVVTLIAALSAASFSGLSFGDTLSLIGQEARDKRFLLMLLLVLPLVSALEQSGLRQYLQQRFAASQRASLSAVLSIYFLVRQTAAALGLTSIGGHAHSVRPLLVPMAEAVAQRDHPVSESALMRLRAFCAGTDNVALFFGEDIFLAFGAVLLMQSVLKDLGVQVDAFQLCLWAIPTAIFAALVQLWRIRRLRVHS